MKLPRKLDYWLGAHAPGLYYVLWTYHLVRNEPPPWYKDLMGGPR